MMHKIIYRIGCLLLLLYAASLQTFAQMPPLDGSITRTGGTADCAWFYSSDAVNIGGKQYSGHGYVADNRGGRAEGAIVFDISGWERFTAVAGLKDEWKGQDGKLTIEVDGRQQFTRQLRAGEGGVAVDIALSGKNSLTIYMEPSMLLAQPLLVKQEMAPFGKEKPSPIDGAAMVWVPGGTFTMGSPDGVGNKNERPAHRVTLIGYWMYKYEVTVAQYRAFCAATYRKLPTFPTNTWGWQGKRSWDDPALQQHPIVNVSWDDAQAYAAWARVALPTEAQWEHAARGPEGRNYPWGGTATANDLNNGWDETKCANHNNSNNVGKSSWPVGSFPAGASWCGAQDMAGNVWEWCADWFGDYSATAVTNPSGPAMGTSRVLRGGSGVYGNPGNFRAAYRNCFHPAFMISYFGFRCVLRSPEQ